MRLLKSHRIFFLSLCIAIFLWLYVRLGATYQMEIHVPFQVTNIKDGYGVVSDIPEAVDILFEGDGKSLLGMRFLNPPRFVLDMAQHKDKSRFILSEHLHEIVYPSKVPVHAIAVQWPDSVIVRMDRMIARRVPVVADVQITCEAGFILVGGMQLMPDSVTVTMPWSYRDSAVVIGTASHRWENLNSDVRTELRLTAHPDKRINVLQSTTSIFLDVQPLGEIVLENLPVRLINVPPFTTVAVQPSTFSVRVRGGVDYLSTLPKESVVGEIDYQKEYNSVQPRLDIRVPSDLTWTQVTPSRFNLVRIEDDSLER